MKMSKSERNKMNKHIITATAGRLFETLGEPMNAMRSALEKVGLKFDFNRAVYAGQNVMQSVPMYSEDPSNGHVEEVENSMLVLNVYRYETGRYEVTAYIS